MANVHSIHSVGASLVTFLRNAYPADLEEDHPCDFSLFSSGDLADIGNIGTTVSLYLYRITMNEHLRGARHVGAPIDAVPPLSVDLHYLISVWADSATAEHVISAWVARELYSHPILDISSLSSDGGWSPEDVVQIIPAELSNEDLMRIWDALAPNYRLSFTFIARSVRIDVQQAATGAPVAATRHVYSDLEDIDA